MSEGSRALSLAPSTSSGSSIGSPEWTCSECQADGAAVELVEYEGNMVCPQCARIDAVASSARGHVDINDISGQIVDRTQSLQSLEKSWNDRSTWHDRGFMVSPFSSRLRDEANISGACRHGSRCSYDSGRLQQQLQPPQWLATLVQRSPKGRISGWWMETYVDTYQNPEACSATLHGREDGYAGDELACHLQQAQREAVRVANCHSRLYEGR
jgi:hypothetical protein